jgi:hypothetical protein
MLSGNPDHPCGASPEPCPLFVDGLIVLAAVFGWRAVRHLVRALREPGRELSSIVSRPAVVA